MSIIRQIGIAVLAVAGLLATARADDLRACSQDELSKATLAPMPKEHLSLNDYSSRRPHMAGYLMTIDSGGRPTVVCAIAPMTEPELLEPGSAAVSKFVYWPEDATPPGGLAYVHLQSQTYGLSIPSVLPRATDPVCDPSMQLPGPEDAKPIFKPKQVYQLKNAINGKQATLTVIMRIKSTGAVQLFCQAAGSNIDTFLEGTYYFLAGIRFAPLPGRPDFTYVVTDHYLLRD